MFDDVDDDDIFYQSVQNNVNDVDGVDNDRAASCDNSGDCSSMATADLVRTIKQTTASCDDSEDCSSTATADLVRTIKQTTATILTGTSAITSNKTSNSPTFNTNVSSSSSSTPPLTDFLSRRTVNHNKQPSPNNDPDENEDENDDMSSIDTLELTRRIKGLAPKQKSPPSDSVALYFDTSAIHDNNIDDNNDADRGAKLLQQITVPKPNVNESDEFLLPEQDDSSSSSDDTDSHVSSQSAPAHTAIPIDCSTKTNAAPSRINSYETHSKPAFSIDTQSTKLSVSLPRNNEQISPTVEKDPTAISTEHPTRTNQTLTIVNPYLARSKAALFTGTQSSPQPHASLPHQDERISSTVALTEKPTTLVQQPRQSPCPSIIDDEHLQEAAFFSTYERSIMNQKATSAPDLASLHEDHDVEYLESAFFEQQQLANNKDNARSTLISSPKQQDVIDLYHDNDHETPVPSVIVREGLRSPPRHVPFFSFGQQCHQDVSVLDDIEGFSEDDDDDAHNDADDYEVFGFAKKSPGQLQRQSFQTSLRRFQQQQQQQSYAQISKPHVPQWAELNATEETSQRIPNTTLTDQTSRRRPPRLRDPSRSNTANVAAVVRRNQSNALAAVIPVTKKAPQLTPFVEIMSDDELSNNQEIQEPVDPCAPFVINAPVMKISLTKVNNKSPALPAPVRNDLVGGSGVGAGMYQIFKPTKLLKNKKREKVETSATSSSRRGQTKKKPPSQNRENENEVNSASAASSRREKIGSSRKQFWKGKKGWGWKHKRQASGEKKSSRGRGASTRTSGWGGGGDSWSSPLHPSAPYCKDDPNLRHVGGAEMSF